MSITAIQLFMSEQIPTPLIFFSSMYSPWSSSAGEHGPPKQSFPASATPASSGGTARLVAGWAKLQATMSVEMPLKELREHVLQNSSKKDSKISFLIKSMAAKREMIASNPDMPAWQELKMRRISNSLLISATGKLAITPKILGPYSQLKMMTNATLNISVWPQWKFSRTLDYGKMSSVEREAWFNRTNNLELKKKIAGVRADRGDYDDVDDIREMSTLFTSETERANFIKRAAKRLPNSDIRTLLAGATGRQERTAISELLADKQDLTGAEILSVYRELGEGSEEGEKFLGKIKFDGLNRTDRDDLYTASDDFADVSTKFKLFEAIVDKGEFDSARLNSMVSAYRTADEKKNLISKAQKKDFVTASQARVAAGFNPNFAAAVTEQLNRMKPDDLADLPAGTKG